MVDIKKEGGEGIDVQRTTSMSSSAEDVVDETTCVADELSLPKKALLFTPVITSRTRTVIISDPSRGGPCPAALLSA